MIIYRTINEVNGKIYIGKDIHNNPKYLGSGLALRKAIKKYGKENFKKEILAWCYTLEYLNFLEKFYISFYNTKSPNGYNLTEGGDGLSNPSEETRKKLRENNGMKKPEAKEKHRKALKIAMNRVKTRKLNSEAKTGDKNPTKRSEVRKKMSDSRKGNKYALGKHWKHSEETKKKIAKSKEGEKNPTKRTEVKEKLSKIFKGRNPWNKGKKLKPLTEQHKRKIGEAVKRKWRYGMLSSKTVS